MNVWGVFDFLSFFKINTESAMSEFNKKYPRSISHISVFPNEEVIYPIACASRIKSIEELQNKTIISLETVDHN